MHEVESVCNSIVFELISEINSGKSKDPSLRKSLFTILQSWETYTLASNEKLCELNPICFKIFTNKTINLFSFEQQL